MPKPRSDPLAAFLGFKVEVDETLPEGEVQIRDADGALAARIVNVAADERIGQPHITYLGEGIGAEPPSELATLGIARARLRGAMLGVLEAAGAQEARLLMQEDLLTVFREWRNTGRDMGGWIV